MRQATYFAQSRPYGLLRTGRVELRTGILGSYQCKSAPMARGILYKIEHWESVSPVLMTRLYGSQLCRQPCRPQRIPD
jgi:hypothetical protein